MDADKRARFIHELKIKLTAISGYAQMVERQATLDGGSSLKQRIYISRLRRLINELILEIIQHESATSSKGSPDDANGDDEPDPPDGNVRLLCREPQC